MTDDVSGPAAPAKRPRGFATLSPAQRREISARGGRAAHLAGTAHEFTRDEAIAAGSKGGKATHARKRGQSPNGF